MRKLLVERAVTVERELYLSLTLDPVRAEALFIACAEGGVEIEQLAVEQPEKIITVPVDLYWGLMPHHLRELTFGLGLSGDTAKAVSAIAGNLYKVFRATGAELAEINPLFINKEGGALAGDGKLVIDDNMGDARGKYPLAP